MGIGDVGEQVELPAMPVIKAAERTPGPYPLVDGVAVTIGWQFKAEVRDGQAFVIIRRTLYGQHKVIESFPLTEGGWASAWRSLAACSPGQALWRGVRVADA
jgi:hypothetical protein